MSANHQYLNRYHVMMSADHAWLHGKTIAALKYCELCKKPFACTKLEAIHPGDFIAIERGAGQRSPIICDACMEMPEHVRMLKLRGEAAQINKIVAEILHARAEKERERAKMFAEHRDSVSTKTSPLRHMSDKRTGERKHRIATWRTTLVEAFRQHHELTSMQIAEIMQHELSKDNPVRRAQQAGCAVHYARKILPIVVSRTEVFHTAKRVNCKRNLYTLSTQEDPTPLTPPQDSETHRFMKSSARRACRRYESEAL